MKKVFLTGAEGRIGTGFREEYLEKYRGKYHLVCGYFKSKPKDDNFKWVKIDITKPDVMKKAFRGVDVVLHLAANPGSYMKFDELLKPNFVGAYTVFEAARLVGVERVIFASSVHAIMAHPEGLEVVADIKSRPDCIYGASKGFGESLCSAYEYSFGMSCIAIRIGAYTSNDRQVFVCDSAYKPSDKFVSQRDLCQLFQGSIKSLLHLSLPRQKF